jgi:citrate lyase subunit beta/citryl-CoA lyase
MLRSFLVVPAIRLDRYWEHLQSLEESALPDAVVIDLEDSVPPNRKVEAAEVLAAWLRGGLPALSKPVRVIIKVDNPRSIYSDVQLRSLRNLCSRFDAIKVAKLEQPDELSFVHDRLPDARLGLIPTIETPLGYANRDALVRSCKSRGAKYVSFGAGDMAASLLVRRSYELDVMKQIFVELAVTSAVHAMLFVDSPSRVVPKTKVASWQEEVARECAWAFSNGAKSKTAVHPAQVPIIHEAWAVHFDVERAEQVEAEFDAEPQQRALVEEASGEYMGTPSLAAARRVIALASSGPDLADPIVSDPVNPAYQ